MQALDFRLQPRQITVIYQHIIGMLQTGFTAGLRLENRSHLLLTGLVTSRRARDLERLWNVHNQHTINLTVLARLDQQRGSHDGVRRLSQGEMPGDLSSNQRVQQLFQPLPVGRVIEYTLTQPFSIQTTIRQQDAGAEALGNLQQRWTPGLDHPARRLIGIDDMYTQTGEAVQHCGLSTTNAASQPENPGLHRQPHPD